MRSIMRWLAGGCVAVLAAAGGEQEARCGEPDALAALRDREGLTDNWLGLGRKLEEQGIALSLEITQIYQANVHGALSTHRRAGRYAGSYDLEGDFDLEKLFRIPAAKLYVLAEGSWSQGLNESSVGSLLNVNDDAGGDRPIDVTQLWYQQSFLDGRVTVRAGKLDLTGGFECRGCPVSFDGNLYANDETTQFLAGALVNNPTIPFPDNGLGAVLHVEPVEGFYASAGIADAQAGVRETGFRTAFHGEDYFFSIFETGFVTEVGKGLIGAYRFGFWYDPQPKERFSGGSTKRDDHGLYFSADQLLWKENADPKDPQGLGAFCRLGYADDDVSDMHGFWSLGGQYVGPVPGRDEDVLGLGVAQGILSRDAERGRTSQETLIEAYYRAVLCPWVAVSGHVQYVANPGGRSDVNDAVVLGVRIQMRL